MGHCWISICGLKLRFSPVFYVGCVCKHEIRMHTVRHQVPGHVLFGLRGIKRGGGGGGGGPPTCVICVAHVMTFLGPHGAVCTPPPPLYILVYYGDYFHLVNIVLIYTVGSYNSRQVYQHMQIYAYLLNKGCSWQPESLDSKYYAVVSYRLM